MEQLERIAEEKTEKNEVRREVSFAEQFLEQPVFAGAYGTLAKITVTCCTYKGIPTVDDY